MSNNRSQVLCRYHVAGVCRYGSACAFSHNLSDLPSQVCKYYLAGCCAYGDHCRYEHKRPDYTNRGRAGGAAGTAGAGAGAASSSANGGSTSRGAARSSGGGGGGGATAGGATTARRVSAWDDEPEQPRQPPHLLADLLSELVESSRGREQQQEQQGQQQQQQDANGSERAYTTSVEDDWDAGDGNGYGMEGLDEDYDITQDEDINEIWRYIAMDAYYNRSDDDDDDGVDEDYYGNYGGGGYGGRAAAGRTAAAGTAAARAGGPAEGLVMVDDDVGLAAEAAGAELAAALGLPAALLSLEASLQDLGEEAGAQRAQGPAAGAAPAYATVVGASGLQQGDVSAPGGGCAAGGGGLAEEGPLDPAEVELCPRFALHGRCGAGEDCPLIHGLECEICHKHQLHPYNAEAAEQHRAACRLRHERLEARMRSAGLECGICLEPVLGKPNPVDRKFGLLSCEHTFCLSCIRSWRERTNDTSLATETAVRTCPVCRTPAHFVTPSLVWPRTPEEKEGIVTAYKTKLSSIDCKHFNFGDGSCPFSTSCFYRHAYRDGRLEDPVLRRAGDADGGVRVVMPVRLSSFFETPQALGLLNRRR
ncbi:hypothetical protein Agub_g3141 [Astrephomene gubernaculifera]|uniref:RING-type E3 ubiquitin transferase n=1 Tax=Astrephomene gubernaculifera TaxID=47775 RepID=A0AAD3HIM3_9CHLO|nr:hypothetical protein Agub_g3141 [Astrephomene gubernaculifera]